MTRFPCLLLFLIPACALAVAAYEKAPFRVPYSDDLTHAINCPSPFCAEKSPFKEKYLLGAVDEVVAAAPDVYMMQPGLGWVPWWPSEVVPINAHIEFLKTVGKNPSSYENYVKNGGDVIAAFLRRVRRSDEKMPAFVSYRMSDVHYIFHGLGKDASKGQIERSLSNFQFFADNPDAWIGDGLKGDQRMRYAMDWGNSKVPEHKFKLVEEVIKNYDLDGLELDFMRHTIRFNPTRTDKDARVKIMTDFVARVRKTLDEKAKDSGKHIWLCLRIPGYRDSFDEAGVDIKALSAAGVDMFNLSNYYLCDMQMEIGEIRALAPDKAFYAEIHFVNANGPFENGHLQQKRAEPAQMRTIAHMAYARGAQGVSFFNFPYHRGTFDKSIAPSHSQDPQTLPPFEIFKELKDPAFLAAQPQYYAVGKTYNTPRHTGRPFHKTPALNQTETIKLDMAPPTDGWKRVGKLRIQALGDLKTAKFKVSCNGKALQGHPDVSPLHEEIYEVAKGSPEQYRAFILPAGLLKDGTNSFEITQTSGEPAQLFFMDIALP